MEITFQQGIKTVVPVADRKLSGRAVNSVELGAGMTSLRSYKMATCVCRQYPILEETGHVSA